MAEPVVRIGGARAQREDVVERGALRLLGRGEPRDRERIGQAAHEIRVADLAEVAAVGRRARRELGGRERRAPHLHRVHARRLGGRRAHHDELAIGEQRVAVAADRRADALLDQVVGVEQIRAVAAAEVDVEDVLAVRRLELVLEDVFLRVAIEQLVVAADEHVPAGEHDAVILGQRAATLADAIGADHLLRARVEHEIAPRGLAERQDFEEDEAARLADRGVEDLGVVERLIGIVDRLGINAFAGLGVVLDLDREIAVHALDEQRVEQVVVRVLAGDLVIARDLDPREVVRRREQRGVIAIAAIVDVDHRAIRLDPPAQDLRVLVRRARLEDGEELRVALDELDEPRLFVVAIQVREVALELGALQPRRQRQRRGIERDVTSGLRREPMQREHVADLRFGLEPEEHVVTEEHVAADGHEVARRAVVLGAHALGRDELRARSCRTAPCGERSAHRRASRACHPPMRVACAIPRNCRR